MSETSGAGFTKGLRLSLDLGYVRDLNLSPLSLLSLGPVFTKDVSQGLGLKLRLIHKEAKTSFRLK